MMEEEGKKLFKTSLLVFKGAKQDQITLLKDWLKKDYIKEFWGNGGLTLPDYEKFTTGEPSLFRHYFGYLNDKPLVFLMTSELEKGHDFEKWKEKDGINLSLDFMIGDERFVGKGIAHEILNAFIKSECFYAKAIFVDPELTNQKAIRVYEKAGFVSQGIHVPKEGNYSEKKHLILKKKLI